MGIAVSSPLSRKDYGEKFSKCWREGGGSPRQCRPTVVGLSPGWIGCSALRRYYGQGPATTPRDEPIPSTGCTVLYIYVLGTTRYLVLGGWNNLALVRTHSARGEAITISERGRAGSERADENAASSSTASEAAAEKQVGRPRSVPPSALRLSVAKAILALRT